MTRKPRSGGAGGSRVAGLVALAIGLVLLGLCLSQWTDGTGSTMGRALGDYNGGDRRDLGTLGASELRTTSQTAVEGLAGVFWVGIGAFLLWKARAARAPDVHAKSPRMRR